MSVDEKGKENSFPQLEFIIFEAETYISLGKKEKKKYS
jgi:hypothetical protein